MLFGYLTLITALAISISAGVYSVIGLTAIFSGAFWPIVIMGGTLEVGKIVTTLWLHKYWERAELRYRFYLSSAVAVLMVLTSMGVFGYLSKAHTEAGVATGDVTAQVSIYDEKIRTQRDNIDAARRALAQMDSAVDQTIGRSTSETGVDRAVAIRRSQAKERTKLQNEIAAAQTEIVKLQDQRAPFAAQQRQVEADVGPIKYIAALIYGDTTDSTTLEHAVRWVIILIVAVFDPLALTLLLAATKTFEWERKTRKKDSWDEFFNSAGAEIPEREDKDEPRQDVKRVEELFERLDEEHRAHQANIAASEIETPEPEIENIIAEEDESQVAHEANLLVSEIEPPEPVVDNIITEEIVEPVVRPKRSNRERNAKRRAKKQALFAEAAAVEQEVEEEAHIEERPGDYVLPSTIDVSTINQELKPLPDNEPTVGHGTRFPRHPKAGDMFVRTDMMPSRLFKFTGDNWLEMDKSGVAIQYPEEYIQSLIDKIMINAYNLEHLTDVEKEQIAERLAHGA